MKKIYMFALGTLLSVGLFAQNRSVTFRVDMTGQTVGPNGVHIAGSFQNPQWQANATTMTQVGATSIYTAVVQIPDGMYEFKFINGNSWSTGIIDAVPSESQVGGGNDNRFVHITKDTILAAVPFAGNNPAGLQLMRFKVDMALQTVSPNGVHVAGDFQNPNWVQNGTRMYNVNSQRPSLFERIVYVASGTYEYKFINDSAWGGSENVPTACQVGGGNSNRQIAVSGATVIPEVCFGMCTACPTAPIPQYSFTVRVDMQNHAKCNTFTTVDIAGPLNGWNGGDTLTPIGNDIYEITLMLDSGEVQFKFRDITSSTAAWEGAANRFFVLSQNDTGEFCYNVDGLGFCSPIPDEADITFRVDFSQAGVTPAVDIWLIGDFTAWQANAIKMDPVLTSPGLYETTIQDFCPGSLFYKFVNGDLTVSANEENSGLDSCGVPNGVGGFNRFFERTNNDPVVLQYVFNTCNKLTIGVEENQLEAVALYPNPMRDFTTVNVGEGNYNITIMDLTSRAIRQIGNASGQIVIERGTLTSGMYILNVINNKGESRTTKFIVE